MDHDEREPSSQRPAGDQPASDDPANPAADTAHPDSPSTSAPRTEPESPDSPSPSAASSEPAWPEAPAQREAVDEGGITCPRCATQNPAGLSFCRSCGQRLVASGAPAAVDRPSVMEGTMACPRCGTHNRAGVAFCQNCGANLRGVGPGYVAPAPAATSSVAERRGGAVLGPVVLLIGLAGLVTGYLLPFAYGSGSLWDRAAGSDGYGIAFWAGYPEIGAALTDQAYYGLAGPLPVLGALLLVLAIAGFVRAAPGPIQTIGLAVALLWSIGIVVLFVVVELAGNWDGDLVRLLSALTPAGIIFFLSSLIVIIGALTRFGRS